MKANVWEYSGLDVGEELDREAEKLLTEEFKEEMELFGTKEGAQNSAEELEKRLMTEPFKGQWGAYAAMSGNSSVPATDTRIHREVVGQKASRRRRSRAENTPGSGEADGEATS